MLHRGDELGRFDELDEARDFVTRAVEPNHRREADDLVLLLKPLRIGGFIVGRVDASRDEPLCLATNFGMRERLVLKLFAGRTPRSTEVDDYRPAFR